MAKTENSAAPPETIVVAITHNMNLAASICSAVCVVWTAIMKPLSANGSRVHEGSRR